MPVKTGTTTEERLRKTPLPRYGGKYAVITHGDLIDLTRTLLKNAGFQITGEVYRASQDGKIANATYTMIYSEDPDMNLIFTWVNSYNKMIRFSCSIGGEMVVNGNSVIKGSDDRYARKHLGNQAYSDIEAHMTLHINNAAEYFDLLIKDKQILKSVKLSLKDKGAIIGQLFMSEEILTLTQIGIVWKEILKPSYNYSDDPDSAWDLYNHIALALKESHPMHYIDNHIKMHSFLINNHAQLHVKQPEIINEKPLYGVMFE